jgi:hypothetical protein
MGEILETVRTTTKGGALCTKKNIPPLLASRIADQVPNQLGTAISRLYQRRKDPDILPF